MRCGVLAFEQATALKTIVKKFAALPAPTRPSGTKEFVSVYDAADVSPKTTLQLTDRRKHWPNAGHILAFTERPLMANIGR